jgi:hypothetical protein
MALTISLFCPIPVGGQTAQSDSQQVDQSAQIESLVQALGSPDFNTRRQATHRLVALAPVAVPQLKTALQADDYELRLRAQNLLTVIESILFNGVAIKLSAEPQQPSWDTPVTLTITFENRANFETSIPVEHFLPDDESDEVVRRFAQTMDVAEYLTVTAPNGREVSLKTDDLTVDSRLEKALSRRVEGAVLSALGPGMARTVTIPAFNQNAARYPMLREGVYKIQIDYVPQWNENELHTMKAGYVSSNVCEVHIRESAPPIVLAPGPEVGLVLAREKDRIVASIENRSDVARAVNLNFGMAAPFADFLWFVHKEDGKHELIELSNREPVEVKKFEGDRIRWIKPAEKLIVAEVPVAKVNSLAGTSESAEPPVISVQYYNECGRRWQQSLEKPLPEGAPEVLTAPLPHRIVTVPLRSNPLPLEN